MAGEKKINASDFDLLKVLGAGSLGATITHRVLEKERVSLNRSTIDHTMTERNVLVEVRNSPFLATLYYAFQTLAKLLRYWWQRLTTVGGELFTHHYQRNRFQEPVVRFFMGEIILAQETLHNLGIIYRDLKMENILLNREGHIVVADFGLTPEDLLLLCEYMAPDMLHCDDGMGYDKDIDWWALGVLTYELAVGGAAFNDEECQSQKVISRKLEKRIRGMFADPTKVRRTLIICNNILTETPPIPGDLSAEISDFIGKLLTKYPMERLGSG
ncbi:Ribosomal protein S6 kinase alpha-5 [Blattella germanica]|nr:Ribosomal protein S6 kinase alpha-5 [Blattella germanica]